MPIQRLNHAVLYVRDVSKSVALHSDLLGFRAVMEVPGRAAFLLAPGSENDHDLGLFQIGIGRSRATRANRPSVSTTLRGRWTRSQN